MDKILRQLMWQAFHALQIFGPQPLCSAQSLQKEAKQLVYCTYSMTKVVLRGSWGCHHCKTDRGPPYFRMSLRRFFHGLGWPGEEKTSRSRRGERMAKNWAFWGGFGVNISATGWVRCLILVVKTLWEGRTYCKKKPEGFYSAPWQGPNNEGIC